MMRVIVREQHAHMQGRDAEPEMKAQDMLKECSLRSQGFASVR